MQSLSEQIRGGDIIVAPGIYDHVSLLIADQMNFGALFASGFWAAASGYGQPDIGITGMAEFVDTFSRYARQASTPIIADADTGFGSVETCALAAASYQRAGIAGFQIEDQLFPKICGHSGIPQCVSIEEMEARIASAIVGRGDGEMLIIARTDACVREGFQAALTRLVRYQSAGADILLLEAASSVDEIQQAAAALKVPLMVNAAHGGRTPVLSPKEYASLGVRVVIYPSGAGLAAAGASQDFYRSLAADSVATGSQWMAFKEVAALTAAKRP